MYASVLRIDSAFEESESDFLSFLFCKETANKNKNYAFGRADCMVNNGWGSWVDNDTAVITNGGMCAGENGSVGNNFSQIPRTRRPVWLRREWVHVLNSAWRVTKGTCI
jgi:hypothetical protein